MPSVGPLEIAILLALVLFVFGSKRLPELGSSAGKAVRGFGRGLRGQSEPAAEPEPERLDSTRS